MYGYGSSRDFLFSRERESRGKHARRVASKWLAEKTASSAMKLGDVKKNVYGMIQWHMTESTDAYLRYTEQKRKAIEFVCGCWAPAAPSDQNVSGYMYFCGSHKNEDGLRVIGLDSYRIGISKDGMGLVDAQTRTHRGDWSGSIRGESSALPAPNVEGLPTTVQFDSYEDYKSKVTQTRIL